MKLSFEKVNAEDLKKIYYIYQILKKSGEDLYYDKGLKHWSNPYPPEQIIRDCKQNTVYLIKDIERRKYIHTFQLARIESEIENSLEVRKFSTLPGYSGKGVGKESIKYIEEYSRNLNVDKLCLDVYEKSLNAISFYKNRGFVIVGNKATRRFKVLKLEKLLI